MLEMVGVAKKRNRLLTFKYPVLLMLLIFIESSIPMDGGPDSITFLMDLEPTIQNFLHIPLYGVLSFLWMRSLIINGFKPATALVTALFVTILYGCLDEVHQTFVPGRFGGLADIYLNSIGGIIGVFVCRYCGNNIKNKYLS